MRFDNAIAGKKVVKNSAIASGSGQGVHFKKSKNIEWINNSVFDFLINGIKSFGSSNIVMEDSHVVGVRPLLDRESCKDILFTDFDSGIDLGDVN